MTPLDGELAAAFHWVVMLAMPAGNIFGTIIFAVGFGVLGAGIGFAAGAIAIEMGVLGGDADVDGVFLGHMVRLPYGGYTLLSASMFMGGVLGAVIGGCIGKKWFSNFK